MQENLKLSNRSKRNGVSRRNPRHLYFPSFLILNVRTAIYDVDLIYNDWCAARIF